ncbi:hypothetical protein B1C81_17610 [Streptomyces sp. HG99]|nr:hypothetical protein B1C81_17610 [Streptomyces sp. HG99]
MEEDLEWPSVPLGLLREAGPWWTFRWYKGQQHYSDDFRCLSGLRLRGPHRRPRRRLTMPTEDRP